MAYVRALGNAASMTDWINAGTNQVNVGGPLHPVSVVNEAAIRPDERENPP